MWGEMNATHAAGRVLIPAAAVVVVVIHTVMAAEGKAVIRCSAQRATTPYMCEKAVINVVAAAEYTAVAALVVVG